MPGPEEHYALGERIARDIHAPVTRSHRITVEPMAILAPAMAETVAIGLMMTVREALEEAVRRGVLELFSTLSTPEHAEANDKLLDRADRAVKLFERTDCAQP